MSRAGFRRTVLDARAFAATRRISSELLRDDHPGRELAVGETLDGLLMSIRQHVYTDLTRVDGRDVPWSQEVPWSRAVTVPIPNRWWRRLLRRPEQTVERTVGGTVTARGTVRLTAEAGFAFPDMDPAWYPRQLGEPVPIVLPVATPTWDPFDVSVSVDLPERGPR